MNDLRQLIASGAFSDLDRHFAKFVEAQAGGNRPLLALAAALTSHVRTAGHICLDLPALAGTPFPEKPEAGLEPMRLPGLTAWLKELQAASVVGAPGEFCPLVLDDCHRLYLHRYWEYEQTLAAEIRKRAGVAADAGDEQVLAQKLKAWFPAAAGEVDWQSVAAFVAVRGKFCCISGGPGTGKTHTLVLIMALLLELDATRTLRIALTAPTGKAAARIQESIQNIKAALACSEEIKSRLPENASTIHRLLGAIPDSAYFRHHARNPLPFDVVVVDEASMVDLALMAKLLQAVPPAARVILLGDKDQLASVEAGAVLGDICSAAVTGDYSQPFRQQLETLTGQTLPASAPRQKAAALADSVVQLKKNYRFGEHSAIFQLSAAINAGREEAACEILRRATGSDLTAAALPSRAKLKAALREKVLAGFHDYLEAENPLQAIAALARFRVLCALREGTFGVAGLNRIIEEILEEAGFISRQSQWYSRRPIMITRNDYNLKLFNGDNGIIMADPASGEPVAIFPGPDNRLRQFLPLRLPQHETAYALTVHKSQGSEFHRVLLVLPDRPSPVLTRELLYTGITRARQGVELWYEDRGFRAALSRSVRRTSGLRDALARE